MKVTHLLKSSSSRGLSAIVELLVGHSTAGYAADLTAPRRQAHRSNR